MSFGTGKIWMNGSLLDWDEAKIHIGSHLVHYGSGVFEGARCYETPNGSVCFRLDDHLRRLYDSAKIYRMEYHLGRQQFQDSVLETIRANAYTGLLHPPAHLSGLRHTRRRPPELSGGRGHHGLGVGEVPRRRKRSRREWTCS